MPLPRPYASKGPLLVNRLILAIYSSYHLSQFTCLGLWLVRIVSVEGVNELIAIKIARGLPGMLVVAGLTNLIEEYPCLYLAVHNAFNFLFLDVFLGLY
jgi:hypothetical protein